MKSYEESVANLKVAAGGSLRLAIAEWVEASRRRELVGGEEKGKHD